MAKKITRTIPVMMIHIDGDAKADVDTLCSNEVFSTAVFRETLAGIKDALKNKKQTAILFEVDKSDYFVEISKSDWEPALQSCIDELVLIEKFEDCIEIQTLIKQIK